MDNPQLYESLGDRGIRCLLCPHSCVLKNGMTGICGVRKAGERGINSSPAPVTVMAIDPVEKKPFYHFMPGTFTLSIGFSGCNLKCPFCQNHDLVDSHRFRKDLTPDKIVEEAIRQDMKSVCFTYSEPLMHIEFLVETAGKLKSQGIKVLLVTNGSINKEPARWLLSTLDAVKVDLKSFNPDWYRKELKGNLPAVKDFITLASEMVHLEVVTLIIPGKNDSDAEIHEASRFIGECRRNIPYHLTAYYPQHHYSIEATPIQTLNRLKKTALESLNYVYTGNMGYLDSTYCTECGTLLINRQKGIKHLIDDSLCPGCGTRLYGNFRF